MIFSPKVVPIKGNYRSDNAILMLATVEWFTLGEGGHADASREERPPRATESGTVLGPGPPTGEESEPLGQERALNFPRILCLTTGLV